MAKTTTAKKTAARRAFAQSETVIRVATISVPGSQPRSYVAQPDDDVDTMWPKYKKEMGIVKTSADVTCTFQEMPESSFRLLHDRERGLAAQMLPPAIGNPARGEGTNAEVGIDRGLTEDEEAEFEAEQLEYGAPLSAGPRPVRRTDQEPGLHRASSLESVADEGDEEEEEDEEIELDRDEVSAMKIIDLRALGTRLGIKKAKTLQPKQLRKKILALVPEEEEEEEEDED